jgi:hypothetical protein
MKRILLNFADGSYRCGVKTASAIVKSLPADRYVTTTLLKDKDDDDDEEDEDEEDSNDNPNPSQPKRSGVFERYKSTLTSKEQGHVKRIAKAMLKKR